MQLREAIAIPITLIISFNFSIARVVKHTLDDFSNILLETLRERHKTNYELRITNYELRITNYELRITNYELRITNYLNDSC
ncbi:hypothetical protein [Nostoc sphaeroides]|uniref:hypothetical protein n=1 Tax=Nostoc sphaeroides TaxID=446679 RepID=UPI000E4C4BD4|nr:hypothetical protein [Nostoc sphaeroides]